MANSIVYKQSVKVIEYYEIEYTEKEFEFDCETYSVEGITYQELCGIMSGQCGDILISVNEPHVNDDGVWVNGPRFISAIEFFNRIMCDSSFECGYNDREELEILERQIYIVEE